MAWISVGDDKFINLDNGFVINKHDSRLRLDTKDKEHTIIECNDAINFESKVCKILKELNVINCNDIT